MSRFPLATFLLETDNDAADEALLESLAHVEPALLADVVDVLLSRAQNTGLSGIIARFDRFPDVVQSAIVKRADAIAGAVAKAARGGDTQTRTNAIEIVIRHGSIRGASILSSALLDGALAIRERAANALRALAERRHTEQTNEIAVLVECVAAQGMKHTDAASRVRRFINERKPLMAALTEALDGFDRHHRTEILDPIMWFSDAMGASIWPKNTPRDSRTVRALSETLHRRTDPRHAAFAMRAMLQNEMRGPACHVVATARDDTFVEALLREAWLMADPRLHGPLQRVRSLSWLGRAEERLSTLPERLQARWVRLVARCGLPIESKVEFLSSWLRSESAPIRRAALWALVDLESPATSQILTEFAEHAEPAMANVARRELRSRGKLARERRALPATPSDAPAVPSSPEAITFERFWDTFYDLTDNERHEWIRKLTVAGVNFKSELRRRITSITPADQIRGLSITVQAGLVDAFRTEIYRLAHDADPLVRATTISLLAMLPGPTTERMLITALTDDDRRVQANAIEAIDAMGVDHHTELVIPKLTADSPRVRANAIQMLLRRHVREAAESMIHMLNDPDRGARLSALWVVERMGLTTLLPRLSAIAQSDPDPQIRARAVDVAERLKRPGPSPLTAHSVAEVKT